MVVAFRVWLTFNSASRDAFFSSLLTAPRAPLLSFDMLQRRLRPCFFFLLSLHENNCCKILLRFLWQLLADSHSTAAIAQTSQRPNVWRQRRRSAGPKSPGKLSPRFTAIHGKWCEGKSVLMPAFLFSLSSCLAPTRPFKYVSSTLASYQMQIEYFILFFFRPCVNR